MSKIKKYALILIILCFLIIISFCKFNFTFTKNMKLKTDYSNFMEQSIENKNPYIKDIAMLGAHDAFSNHINTGSKLDPMEKENNSLVSNSFVNIFLDGFMVRMSKAQKSSTEELLNFGVRYLDVRLSYFEDTWYTKHNYISNEFKKNVLEILRFLDSNQKEFLVLDFQHVYYGEKDSNDLYDFLTEISFNEKTLFDYISYSTTEISAEELRYNDVVTDKAGVLLLIKNVPQKGKNLFYNYSDSLRSTWHNENSFSNITDKIELEYQYLEDNPENKLVVNQAQFTGFTGFSDLANSIFGISLLDMAEKSNIKMLEHDSFEKWLTKMPIFMVDYATSYKNDFNTRINDILIRYNKNL